MDTHTLRRQVGMEIRSQRESQDLSLKKLAGMVGTSYTHLWKVETGKVSVGLDLLGKIAEALDVPLATLVTPSERSWPPSTNANDVTVEYDGR